MALSLRGFLIGLWVAVGMAIFLLEPYSVHQQAILYKPQVVFEQFESYFFTGDIVESRLVGKRAEQYPGKTVLFLPRLMRRHGGMDERAQAKKGILIADKRLELVGDVLLQRGDGWYLKTSYLRYDIEKQLYTTEGMPFYLTYHTNSVRGRNLRYDAQRKKVQADAIDAIIQERNRS